MGYGYNVVLAVVETVSIPELNILEHSDRSWYTDGYRYYQWYYTKWGDQYPDVRELEKWLEDLDSQEREEDYYLLMKGEDLDDITSRGWSYDAQVWPDICTPEPSKSEELFDHKVAVIIFLVGLVLILL